MKKLLSIIILFFVLNTFSQKEANFWYFGNKAALDFNTGEPKPVSGSLLNTTEGCSSFSDADGNLLFYIGGPSPDARNLTIWGKDNIPMPNGTGLQGDSSSSQAALTIPAPGKPNIYYLFTVGAPSSSNQGFWFYTIDMSLNGGNGDVVGGATDLSGGNSNLWSEKVTAVRSDSCNEFWVISFRRPNLFYAYKVNSDGVDVNNPEISAINNYNISLNGSRGYLKVSPDGKILVAANMNDDTFIFNFNDITGNVTNFNNATQPSQLNTNGNNGYGVEFSTSSEVLYVSTGNFGGDTENLFQYDLTKPTLAEINNTNNGNPIFSYFNTRGALQLGPDGKIYWASDNSNAISVINTPEGIGDEANYSHQSVNLGVFTLSTQGLPPFLSSLLLPLEIKDSDTDEVITNQSLQFCVGDNKTIIPEDVTGNGINVTHEWKFNDGSSESIIANTAILSLDSLRKSQTGKYTLTIELEDDCGNPSKFIGTFNIEVFDAAKAKTLPNAINFCDTDITTDNDFDLTTIKNTEILDGLDPTIFDVLYFDTQKKAEDNISGTELPNPYQVNTASIQTIYARVQNKNAPNSCFALTNFQLEVTNNPEPNQPSVYRLCDDIASGTDIDTITNSFRLDTKDTEILGNLDPNQYLVSYHTTLADAQTSSSSNTIDKTTDYAVTNSQRIYVRVENKDNLNCNAVSDDSAGSTFRSFELVVTPLPIIKDPNPAEIRQCVNTLDGKSTINLTIAESNISDNVNGTFEYYEDQTATQQILNFTSYPIDANTSPPKSVWVKTISEFECFRISELKLIIGTAPDEAYNETFIKCDDYLDVDGNNTSLNSDTDGITLFDLDQNTIKNNINTNTNIDVFFYETIKDRAESKNDIDISNYRNKNIPNISGNKFPIYYKLVNKINSDCEGFGQIYFQVNPVPIANPVLDLVLCDDALSGNTTDGENTEINLRDNVATILGATQNSLDFIVSFHTSLSDANDLTNTGIANDTNFRNSAPIGFTAGDISEQTIFVRVINSTGNPQCINTNISFKIIVNPIPDVSTTISPLAVCDIDSDPRNRITQNIDLTTKNAEILTGKVNHRVAYYATLNHAVAGTPEITNPNNFQNDPTQTTFPTNFNTDEPGIQTIFFAIVDQGGNMCRSVFSTYQLIIYPEPNIPINITDYSDCDNKSDSFEEDDNGINGDISLITKKAEVLANYPDTEHEDFDVTFYTTLSEAESGNTSLAIDDTRFENDTNNQTIYVRVENRKNSPVICTHTRLSFKINIKPLPNFIVMGEKDIDDPLILCLNETTLDISAENPDTNYDYQWTDQVGNILGNTQTLSVNKEGEYTVTASDKSPDGCPRSRTIVVKESNVATLTADLITVIDESNNISFEDNISIFIETANNILGPGDYQFAIRNDDKNITTPLQDEPLFEDIEGGIYTVIVNDKNGCSPDEELQISVIQFPKFFTPNADGKNDTWIVKGANETFYPNASINIFNRFGKLVAQIPIDNQGWNGTYNGNVLPSDDYWFNIQLIPADNTKPPILKKGHFSLLRN